MPQTDETELVPSRVAASELNVDRSTLSRMVARGIISPALEGDGIRGPRFFRRSEIERVKQERAA